MLIHSAIFLMFHQVLFGLLGVIGTYFGQPMPDEPKIFATNLTGFTIPFQMDNADGRYIEVQLFVSNNQGESWSLYGRQPPEQNGFPFQATGMGEYWFALRTLDRNRQLIPGGKITQPELKVMVDLKKPKIEFDLFSDNAGRAVANWRLTDHWLDPASLKIEYRAAQDREWHIVEFAVANDVNLQNYADRIAWWPESNSDRIEVRLSIADRAGNQSRASRYTTLSRPTPRKNTGSTVANNKWVGRTPTQKRKLKRSIECKNGVCKIVDGESNETSRQVEDGQQAEFIAPPPPTDVQIDDQNSSEARPDSIAWQSSSSKNMIDDHIDERTATAPDPNINQFQAQSSVELPIGLSDKFKNIPVVNRKSVEDKTQWQSNSNSRNRDKMFISQSTTYGDRNNRQSASKQKLVEPRAQFSSLSNENQLHREHSAVISHDSHFSAPSNPPINTERLMVNTRRFKLNYGISAIDQSGVGKVILWLTRDGGENWDSFATDDDNTSPIQVTVDGDGEYGFKVVVHSKDGLIGQPPSSGEQPDVIVEVDLTVPKVALTSAPFGSGKDLGKLVIHWSASDNQLKNRPIDLFYSPNPNGPWSTIQKRLRNTGIYAWKVPQQVPEQVYLRIEASDAALNKGIFQLTQPIDISGLVPRGRITSVDPVR